MGREEFATRIRDDHAVFETDAPFAVEVDTGLVGEGHAGLKLGLVAADKVRSLVHVEPDAVT